MYLDKNRYSKFRKVVVVGDLHGDYKSLNSLLDFVDSSVDGLIFLGDYADRGQFGFEVVRKLDILAKDNSGSVFLLKGNHEDYDKDGYPRFWPCNLCEEVEKKIGSWQRYYKDEFLKFLGMLHLAVVFEGWLLFVHGGVSSKIDSLNRLLDPSREVERDVLWSDPSEEEGERSNITRGGAGVLFGADITRKVCNNIGVKAIIRGHQPRKARNAPVYEHDGKIITINSTSLYGGTPFALSLNPRKPSKFDTIRLQ